jgi:hypothetical protein
LLLQAAASVRSKGSGLLYPARRPQGVMPYAAGMLASRNRKASTRALRAPTRSCAAPSLAWWPWRGWRCAPDWTHVGQRARRFHAGSRPVCGPRGIVVGAVRDIARSGGQSHYRLAMASLLPEGSRPIPTRSILGPGTRTAAQRHQQSEPRRNPEPHAAGHTKRAHASEPRRGPAHAGLSHSSHLVVIGPSLGGGLEFGWFRSARNIVVRRPTRQSPALHQPVDRRNYDQRQYGRRHHAADHRYSDALHHL